MNNLYRNSSHFSIPSKNPSTVSSSEKSVTKDVENQSPKDQRGGRAACPLKPWNGIGKNAMIRILCAAARDNTIGELFAFYGKLHPFHPFRSDLQRHGRRVSHPDAVSTAAQIKRNVLR